MKKKKADRSAKGASKRILFVCRTNHFRSTVAEQILKKLRKDLIVRSAGTEGPTKENGKVVPAPAWKKAAKAGISIRYHRPRKIDPKMVKYFDNIYVFEKAHKNYIENKFPSARGKVFIVKENRDFKGRPEKEALKFISDMRIILKNLAKKL